jgi:hypothetical protein
MEGGEGGGRRSGGFLRLSGYSVGRGRGALAIQWLQKLRPPLERRNPARTRRLSRGSICPKPFASSDAFRLSGMIYTLMADADQDAFSRTDIAGLTATISPERFNTYLIAAGHDPARALRLYMWNAQVGEAFHVPIQAVEVSLRNRVNAALVAAFGPDWWQAQPFLDIADDGRRRDLEVARQRIMNRQLPLVTGQIVAGLSFVFWVGMLQGSYNPPVWGGLLRATCRPPICAGSFGHDLPGGLGNEHNAFPLVAAPATRLHVLPSLQPALSPISPPEAPPDERDKRRGS